MRVNFSFKRFVKNAAVVCVSTLSALCAIELVFRFLGYGNLEIYDPDPNLYWKLRPNQDCVTKIGSRNVHINSKGTRGSDFETQKPKGTFRILSLGDSRTYGWGLSDTETYSFLIQNSLQTLISDNRKVEVINAGVNAWSYDQIYVYLRDEGLAYDPDVVIVAEANLWTEFREEASVAFKAAFAKRVWLKNLLRRSALYHYLIEVRLAKFYAQYREKLIPLPEREDEAQFRDRAHGEQLLKSRLESICKLLKSKGIGCLLLYIPAESEIRPPSAEESLVLRVKKELSIAYAIPLLNLTEDFSLQSVPVYEEADPVHPNALGNRLVAQEITGLLSMRLHQW